MLVPDRTVFWQAARFGGIGLALTGIMSGCYLVFEKSSHFSAGSAVIIATVIATIIGYFSHSAVSFRGFGARDQQGVRFGRFVITNTIGLLLNYLFVKILVDMFGWESWSPIPLFVLLTPTVTFLLNRNWVFTANDAS